MGTYHELYHPAKPVFFKVVQQDGSAFQGDFRWNVEPGRVSVHPKVTRANESGKAWAELDDPSKYLSVTDSASHVAGSRFVDDSGQYVEPLLLAVQSVAGFEVFTPEPDRMPHKRAALAWRVIANDLDVAQVFGPNGREVIDLYREWSADHFVAPPLGSSLLFEVESAVNDTGLRHALRRLPFGEDIAPYAAALAVRETLSPSIYGRIAVAFAVENGSRLHPED